MLAAIGAGLLRLEDIPARWRRERRFVPAMDATERVRKRALWADAVRRTIVSTNGG
jgi:glycerol kinase